MLIKIAKLGLSGLILVALILTVFSKLGPSEWGWHNIGEQARTILSHNARAINAWHGMESGVKVDIRLDQPRQGKLLANSIHFSAAKDSEDATHGTPSLNVRRSLGSLDASRFEFLTLWVRGENQQRKSLALDISFTLGDPEKPHREVEWHSYVVGLGNQWTPVVVPLREIARDEDWRRLTGINLKVIPGKLGFPSDKEFWIDEIALVSAHTPEEVERNALIASPKMPDLAQLETPEEHRDRLRARLVGWPKQIETDRSSLPTSDQDLLMRLALDTWRGIDELTDKETGLPLDRIQFSAEGNSTEDAWIGDYTNITNIGFYLLSVAAARELGLISSEAAIEKVTKTLTSLEAVETKDGFFYNYYNTTTLAKTDDLISFVDSSWLTSGLMVTRQAFPELSERASRLIDQGNYRFFYEESNGLMSHGYNARQAQRLQIYYGVFFTEARLGSLIGIGKGDIPQQQWFQTARTMPEELTWQRGVPVDRREQHANGLKWISGHYRWHDLDYVPSWGGSMFEALMPLLVIDEIRYAPDSLGKNDVTHTRLQRIHAMEDLGYPVWGMSPSSTPDGKGYTEYGVPMLGVGGYKAGAVTPHAAVLALMTDPKEAIRNIRRLIDEFPVYGDYGLYDAVDPITHQTARNYLCLDQAMILLALANYMKDHAIQKYFALDPITQRALPLLKIERF